MFGFLRLHAASARLEEMSLAKRLVERECKKLSDQLAGYAVDIKVADDKIEMLLGQIEDKDKLINECKVVIQECRNRNLDIDHENAKLRESNRLITYKLDSASAALKIFAERYKISAAELRQLHVADMAIADPDKQGQDKAKPIFAPFLADDPLVVLNAGNDFKQTAGKFRQLRTAFQSLQLAITEMFDGMERDAKKEPLSKDRVRAYRETASGLIGRRV